MRGVTGEPNFPEGVWWGRPSFFIDKPLSELHDRPDTSPSAHLQPPSMFPKDIADGPATEAQCFFCFEVLTARLETREQPRLDKVTRLWRDYHQAQVKLLELESISSGPSEAGFSATVISPSTTSSDSISSGGKPPSSASSIESPDNNNASYPVYVTWNTLNPSSRSEPKRLRGCIGTFDAMPLENGLTTYSLVSAFEDYRFNPIPESLVPRLGVEITLLGTFEPCKDVFDWKIGTHGLRISFGWQGKGLGATYLPHVCPEQGWTKEECITSLMEKAGWSREGRNKKSLFSGSKTDNSDGAAEPWHMVDGMKVTRYTGFHAQASYEDWKKWRDWAGARL